MLSMRREIRFSPKWSALADKVNFTLLVKMSTPLKRQPADLIIDSLVFPIDDDLLNTYNIDVLNELSSG